MSQAGPPPSPPARRCSQLPEVSLPVSGSKSTNGSPPIITSVGPVPHTAWARPASTEGPSAGTDVKVATPLCTPFECSSTLGELTAQMSDDELPHTAYSVSGTPLAATRQAVPSKRRMVPPEPTAQTSLADEPHTEVSTKRGST